MSQNETQVARRTGGRSARVRTEVLRATLEALAEHGPGAVTVSEIARRSGVHATSIQRRWGALPNLILDALLSHSQEQLPIPDTGTVRDDMVGLARLIMSYLDTPLGTALAQAMATADDDSALADSRAQFWRGRYEATRTIVERAVDRRELPVDTDHQLALELLVAPLHFRALLIRQPVDDGWIERVVDTLLRGLAAR